MDYSRLLDLSAQGKPWRTPQGLLEGTTTIRKYLSAEVFSLAFLAERRWFLVFANFWTDRRYGGLAVGLLGCPCEQQQEKKSTLHVVWHVDRNLSSKQTRLQRRGGPSNLYSRHVSKIQLWQLVTKQEMKQVLHIELLPGDGPRPGPGHMLPNFFLQGLCHPPPTFSKFSTRPYMPFSLSHHLPLSWLHWM